MRANSNEIYLNGEYFRNNPNWGAEDSTWKAGIIQNLLHRNFLSPEEITEIGCGAGGILESLSFDFPSCKFKGFDISPHAINIAKKKTSDRLQFFNQDFSNVDHFQSDLIMVIDVLEHVDNYYEMLRQVKRCGKYFMFHIPLDLSCRTILKPHILLQQRTSVGHIQYFSKEMVEWMLADSGFKIIDWVYTKPVTDMTVADNHKRRIKKGLRNFSFSISKDLSAKLWGSYSMMVLAK